MVARASCSKCYHQHFHKLVGSVTLDFLKYIFTAQCKLTRFCSMLFALVVLSKVLGSTEEHKSVVEKVPFELEQNPVKEQNWNWKARVLSELQVWVLQQITKTLYSTTVFKMQFSLALWQDARQSAFLLWDIFNSSIQAEKICNTFIKNCNPCLFSRT